MFRREMGSKRGSLPPKEGDLTCMHDINDLKLIHHCLHIMISDWEGKGPCTIVPITWKMTLESL